MTDADLLKEIGRLRARVEQLEREMELASLQKRIDRDVAFQQAFEVVTVGMGPGTGRLFKGGRP